jgi:hypothetical protein
MAAEHDYGVEVARRRARPGPYPPLNDRGTRPAHADLRLEQLAGLPLRTVQRLSAGVRDELLEHHRGKQRTAERNGLHARLANLAIISHSLDPGAGEQHVRPAYVVAIHTGAGSSIQARHSRAHRNDWLASHGSTGPSPATTSQTSSHASTNANTTYRSHSPPNHDRTSGGQHLAPDVPAHRRAVVACVGEEVALAAGPGRGADGEARPRIVARLHRQPGQRRV